MEIEAAAYIINWLETKSGHSKNYCKIFAANIAKVLQMEEEVAWTQSPTSRV